MIDGVRCHHDEISDSNGKQVVVIENWSSSLICIGEEDVTLSSVDFVMEGLEFDQGSCVCEGCVVFPHTDWVTKVDRVYQHLLSAKAEQITCCISEGAV